MFEDYIKIIRKRHIIVTVYSIILGLNIPFGGMSIVILYYIITQFESCYLPLVITIWIIEAVLLSSYIGLRVSMNRDDADKSTVAPYVINTSITSYEELIKRSASVLPLEENNSGGYYSFEKKRQGYLCIVLYMESYDKEQYRKIRNKATVYARTKKGLKNKGEREAIRNNIRIYINAFDAFSEEVYKKTTTNAYYGTAHAEGIIDLFMDFSSGKLYIPAYISKWYGGSTVYYKAIKYVYNKLNQAEITK